MGVRRRTIEMGQAMRDVLQRRKQTGTGPSANWNKDVAYAALMAGKETAEEISAYAEEQGARMSTQQISYHLSRDPNVILEKSSTRNQPGRYRFRAIRSP